MRKKFRNSLTVVAFIAPAFIIYTLFMIYPLIDSVHLGFYRAENNAVIFNGIDNYKDLIFNPIWNERFWNAFKNSLVFVAVNLFIQNPLALFIASILAKKIRGSVLYRTIFFAPATLSLVAVAFIWHMLLNPVWGISKATMALLGIKAAFPPVLGLQSTALITLALISGWQYIGVPISLYFASLVSIPDDLIEAAAADGASASQIFWKIKFPLITPVVGIICLMTFLANFSAFDIVYAEKGVFAGPNFATDTLMTFFFRTFFGYYNSPSNPYMGATIAGTMMVTLLIGVIVYFMWRNRQETYQY